jgi:hypothetical protein
MLGQAAATTLLSQLPHLVDAQPQAVMRTAWAPCATKNPVAGGLPFVALLAAKPVMVPRHGVFRRQADTLPGLRCGMQTRESVR